MDFENDLHKCNNLISFPHAFNLSFFSTIFREF